MMFLFVLGGTLKFKGITERLEDKEKWLRETFFMLHMRSLHFFAKKILSEDKKEAKPGRSKIKHNMLHYVYVSDKRRKFCVLSGKTHMRNVLEQL